MQTESTHPQQEIDTNLPPLITRFKSVIIDQLFIIFCMVVLSQILPDRDEQNLNFIKGALLGGLFLMYEPFCIAFGCTVGNLITGIRVRKYYNQEERISIIQSYVRFIVKISLGVISFFTVTSNESKRAIHDMASGSVMIYSQKQ